MKYIIISRFVQSYLCHYLAPGATNLAHTIQSNIYSDYVTHISRSSLGHKWALLKGLPPLTLLDLSGKAWVLHPLTLFSHILIIFFITLHYICIFLSSHIMSLLRTEATSFHLCSFVPISEPDRLYLVSLY